MATTIAPASAVKVNFAKPKIDTTRQMLAAEWHGTKDVRVSRRGRPLITEPKDAIIRITSTTICGSDLHMYTSDWKGMKKGDIMGHEFMGIVEEVGPEVTTLKPGSRVVVSAVIACGSCFHCKRKEFSLCDNTNPVDLMEPLYGQKICGVFGYSHFTGGFDGGQAEYARVPIADVNCLSIPHDIPDEKVLFLSDILCTGWHANEMGNVKAGDTVVVWGCGPVGLVAIMWARFRGAAKVVGIDCLEYRLDKARNILGAETINFCKEDVLQRIKQIFPRGADVCIEAAGFRFPKSLGQKIQRATLLETDTSDILTECIKACRKGGRVSIIGDYFGYTNQFPIGAMMEKGLKVQGGQVFVQKYWKELLGYIQQGKVDPTFLITHRMPLEKADDAYRLFDSKADEVLKIILRPPSVTAL